MRIHWQKTVQVSAPVQEVYAYLADFTRHAEWGSTLERVEQVKPGDATGAGARYIAWELVDVEPSGWRRHLPRQTHSRSSCEIREMVPNRRIRWHAHPIPKVGSAEFRFDLEPAAGGGTHITETADEHYFPPVALMLKIAFNVSEPAIRAMFDQGLERLRAVIEQQRASTGKLSG